MRSSFDGESANFGLPVSSSRNGLISWVWSRVSVNAIFAPESSRIHWIWCIELDG